MLFLEVFLSILLPGTIAGALVWWRFKRQNKLQRLYDEWMDDIVNDQRFSLQSLLDHIHHHTDEGTREGVTGEWLASMTNLIEIVRRKQQLPTSALRHKLERLYLHWQADPQNMTPPPIVKSMRRIVLLLGVDGPPPSPPPPSRVQTLQEEPREEVRNDYGRWHGS